MQKTYELPIASFMETYLTMFPKLQRKIEKNSHLFENPIYLGDKKRVSPLVVLRLDLMVDENGSIKIGENDTVSGGKGPSIVHLEEKEQKEALRPFYQWYKSSGFSKFLYCVEPNSPYLAEAEFYATKLKKYFNLDIESHVVTKGSLDKFDPKITLIDRLFYPHELIEGGKEDLHNFVVTVSATFLESKRVFSYVHDPKNPLGLTTKELEYFRLVFPYSIELKTLMRRYGNTDILEKERDEVKSVVDSLEKKLKEISAPLTKQSLENLIKSKENQISEQRKNLSTPTRPGEQRKRAKFEAKIKSLEDELKFIKEFGKTFKTQNKINNLNAEIKKLLEKTKILDTKINLEKESAKVRKSFWSNLPENDLMSDDSILNYLEKHYPNNKMIEHILFSRQYLIKNTDTEGDNMWGARGVVVLREHSTKKALQYLEYQLHPSIDIFGANPIAQKIHESKDFKQLWNDLVDCKYVTIKDTFNFVSEELTYTNQRVYARIGAFGLLNTETGEQWIPPMGLITTARGTARTHGTPLSKSAPVQFT